MTTERDLLQEARDALAVFKGYNAAYPHVLSLDVPPKLANLTRLLLKIHAKLNSHLSQPESDEGRDARRYRFLRGGMDPNAADDTWSVTRWLDNNTQELIDGSQLDAAIDNALSAGGAEKGRGK